jgi:hypothetical protein
MRTIAILLAATFAASAWSQTTCQNIGNMTYCSDGTNYNRIGNTTYGSDGSTTQRIGNQIYINPGAQQRQPTNSLPSSSIYQQPQYQQQPVQPKVCGYLPDGQYVCR